MARATRILVLYSMSVTIGIVLLERFGEAHRLGDGKVGRFGLAHRIGVERPVHRDPIGKVSVRAAEECGVDESIPRGVDLGDEAVAVLVAGVVGPALFVVGARRDRKLGEAVCPVT